MDGTVLGSYPVTMFGAGVTESLGCTYYKTFISLSTYVFVINITATLLLKLATLPDVGVTD